MTQKNLKNLKKMETKKSITERRTEWKDKWMKENIPNGIRYNRLIHKRIPTVPNLTKLIRYVEKLTKDGLNNKTINIRLLKYRKTQLPDDDIDFLRLYAKYDEAEKIRKDPKLNIPIEILQKDIRELIEEGHEIYRNYMYNVQNPYLKIEKQMVKDYKHEYQEYIKLMKEKNKYLFKDGCVFRRDGGKLTHNEYTFYMHNIQSTYLKIEKQMVKEHKHKYHEYTKLMDKKMEYKENKVEINTIIKNHKEAIRKIENDISRRVNKRFDEINKEIDNWKNKKKLLNKKSKNLVVFNKFLNNTKLL